MLDLRHKTSLRRKGRKTVFSVQIEQESTLGVWAILRSLHDDLPEGNVVGADIDIAFGMSANQDGLHLVYEASQAEARPCTALSSDSCVFTSLSEGIQLHEVIVKVRVLLDRRNDVVVDYRRVNTVRYKAEARFKRKSCLPGRMRQSNI